MPIMRISIIQRMVNSHQQTYRSIKIPKVCYLCKNEIKYGEKYYEEYKNNLTVHKQCLLDRCKDKKITLDYVGERDELYIESPCNEMIKSLYGMITYLEFIVLEAKRLREAGRFPKVEILKDGYTCRLCIEPLDYGWDR